jgi:hypothetical protein
LSKSRAHTPRICFRKSPSLVLGTVHYHESASGQTALTKRRLSWKRTCKCVCTQSKLCNESSGSIVVDEAECDVGM